MLAAVPDTDAVSEVYLYRDFKAKKLTTSMIKWCMTFAFERYCGIGELEVRMRK